MNYKIDTTVKAQSKFIAEDYFPAIIEFSSEELNNHFLEFNFKDTDMFELSVHPKTNALKRFTLTLCNHYEIMETALECPICEEGSLFIEGPDSTECGIFLLQVYSNAVQIKLSDSPVNKSIKSGNLIFSLSDNNELISVIISNLSETDIAHIKRELKA